MTLATTSDARRVRTTTRRTGTTATGTDAEVVGEGVPHVLPSTTPNGTPTTIPTGPDVVACQATVETTWPLTKPSTLSSPTSRRRRETLTTSRWARVAAPKTASIAPKMQREVHRLAEVDQGGGSQGRRGDRRVRRRSGPAPPSPRARTRRHPDPALGTAPDLPVGTAPAWGQVGIRRVSRPAVVSRTPVPRLTNPPSCGKEFSETTRNGSVRLVPECVVTVTSTTEPSWAPTRRMVVRPSPIWSSALGGRPSTVEKRSGPRRDIPTMLPTVTLSTAIIPAAHASVIAVTAVLCSRLWSSVAFGGSKLTCSGSPTGWAWPSDGSSWRRRLRSAQCDDRQHHPEESGAQGNGGSAGPRSKALRTPITALGGAPMATNLVTIAEGHTTGDRSLGRTGPRHPQRRPTAQTRTTTTVASAPNGRPSVSNVKPVEASAAAPLRAVRWGTATVATTTAPAAPATPPPGSAPCRGRTTAVDPPHGRQCRKSSLSTVLWRPRRLADDRQPDQSGECGEDPPPDALGMDGGLDNGGFPVFTRRPHGAAAQIQVFRFLVEHADARCTVAQAHVVLVLTPVWGSTVLLERLVGIEEVDGSDPEGNSNSLASMPTTWKASFGPLGLGSPVLGLL